MIDSFTKARMTISESGLLVPIQQLETVKRKLRYAEIPFTVDEDAIGSSVLGSTALVSFSPEYETRVQGAIDETTGEYDEIDLICNAVRRCFPPSVNLYFQESYGGMNGNIRNARIKVVVLGKNELGIYDSPWLLRVVNGEFVSVSAGKSVIKGKMGLCECELTLTSELPPPVST